MYHTLQPQLSTNEQVLVHLWTTDTAVQSEDEGMTLNKFTIFSKGQSNSSSTQPCEIAVSGSSSWTTQCELSKVLKPPQNRPISCCEKIHSITTHEKHFHDSIIDTDNTQYHHTNKHTHTHTHTRTHARTHTHAHTHAHHHTYSTTCTKAHSITMHTHTNTHTVHSITHLLMNYWLICIGWNHQCWWVHQSHKWQQKWLQKLMRS